MLKMALVQVKLIPKGRNSNYLYIRCLNRQQFCKPLLPKDYLYHPKKIINQSIILLKITNTKHDLASKQEVC